MSLLRVALVVPAVVLLTASLFAQDKNAAPEGKVCVAMVGNASTTSVFVEHMTERLVRSLKQDEVNALGMRSRTSDHYPLQPSKANGQESGQKECEFILLTQVREQRREEPQLPSVSIGEAGGTQDVKGRLQVAFALFRVGRYEPIVDTYVYAPTNPQSSVSDRFLLEMEGEANRVSSEMKKVLVPE